MTEYKEKYEEIKKINEKLQNKCNAYEEELNKKKNFKFEKKLSSLEIEELDETSYRPRFAKRTFDEPWEGFQRFPQIISF